MALPTYVANGGIVIAASDGGNITVPWPAGHQAGDIAILTVAKRAGEAAPTLNSAEGFQEILTWTTDMVLGVFWCRATSGAMASPVVKGTGSSRVMGIITTYRGCIQTGNPYGQIQGSSQAAIGTTQTITGVTTIVADNLIVISAGFTNQSGSFTGWTNANLINLTERVDEGGQPRLAVATGEKSTPGAIGNTTVTIQNRAAAGIVISLLPIPVSGGVPFTFRQRVWRN